MKYFIRWLVRTVINLLADVDANGYEYLPKDTSFVVATNHLENISTLFSLTALIPILRPCVKYWIS